LSHTLIGKAFQQTCRAKTTFTFLISILMPHITNSNPKLHLHLHIRDPHLQKF